MVGKRDLPKKVASKLTPTNEEECRLVFSPSLSEVPGSCLPRECAHRRAPD